MADAPGQVICAQASRVLQAIRDHEGVVIRFTLSCSDPGIYTAIPHSQDAPLVVAHGGENDIARVLEGFVHWTKPLIVYGLYQDGLAEVWVSDQ